MKIQKALNITTILLALVAGAQAHAGIDQQPAIKKPVVPQVPYQLSSFAREAEVKVQFDITEDGSVENVELIDYTNREFGKNVVKALNNWEFTPAMTNGRAVRSTAILPVIYNP